VQLARTERVSLTIIGPETPLVMGVVDAFEKDGLRCFGPRQAAARLEGSKAFAKEFLRRHRIPTAASVTVTRHSFDPEVVRRQRTPIVVKASGLAAGKGVVIEEFLEGEEASFIVMADGSHVLPLATSQDHKRLADGDRGPNTGGMGAYSPAPVVTPPIHARIMREVIEPTIRGLAAEGMVYTGFLYAGVMVAPDGTPNVLEFNCRFGDPETQPILMRLQSDLTALCEAGLDGRLDQVQATWDPRPALGVVMAAEGYPDSPRTGDVIAGLDGAAKLPGKVFHAGTRLSGDQVVVSGGRVLCATALGATVAEAQRAAYALADAVHWRGALYRRDIGYRAIGRDL
jgi:phosphoribosylamine---glycine ligase